jgi:hypothetical protein
MAVTETELELKRGLDQVMYLSVVKYLGVLSLCYGLYGWIILIPVHVTAGGNFTGIASIGLGNVPQGFFDFVVQVFPLDELLNPFLQNRQS